MSIITIADETAFRAALITYVETEPLAGNVFDRRRQITSRKDFFEKLGKSVNAKTEIRFTEIELINIEDSPDEGFDDCPVAVLTYNFHCFHQFADSRSDGSNSDRDFTNLLLRLRSMFLSERSFVTGTGWIVETQPLTGSEFKQFGNDTFTDVLGHYKDLTLEARFYNV